MLRGFAVLSGWVGAFALSMDVLTQHKTQSTFPTESLPDLLCFVQSTFSGEEVIRAKQKQTYRNIT